MEGAVEMNTCGYCGIEINSDNLFCSNQCMEDWYENLDESQYDYGE